MTQNNNLPATQGQTGLTSSQATNEDVLQLVSFKLDDEEFGVPILKVQEINRFPEITKVPQSPSFVEGIINLRGKVVPVISLRKRFGFAQAQADKDARIIVVELNGKVVGFTVDSVREVLRVSSSVVEPPPTLVSGIEREYLSGVAKLEGRLLILLNLDKVLNDMELSQLHVAA